MSVVGIDLSMTSTGVCRIDQGDAQTWRIESTGHKTDTIHDRACRIIDLTDRILQCVTPNDLIIIEGPSLGQARQTGEHLRAGLWWYLTTTLDINGHPIVEIPPATLKKYATGKGTAPKDHVLAAAIRRYPTIPITGNDIADATILAAIGMRLDGNPIDDPPKTHLEALNKDRCDAWRLAQQAGKSA